MALRLFIVLTCLTLALTTRNHFRAGAALKFDGINDYALVFRGFQFLADWTIEAWIMPAAPVAYGKCVFGLQTFSADNLLTVTSTTIGDWQVLYGPKKQPIKYTGWIGRGGQNSVLKYSAHAHHVAVSHESFNNAQSTLKLYVNGTLQAEWVVSTALVRQRSEPELPMLLGACNTKGSGKYEDMGNGVFRSQFFQGHMDEVRWWGKAMTAAAIQSNWRLSGPLKAWPFTPYDVRQNVAALHAQYSLDVLKPQIFDGSKLNRHGWLGTFGEPADSPEYVDSPFGAELMYGSIYRRFQAQRVQTLDFSPYLVTAGLQAANFYNGLLILGNVTPPESGVTLRVQGSSLPLYGGALSDSLKLDVETSGIVENADFAVRACSGIAGQPVQPAACNSSALVVRFKVTAAMPPVVGPAYAVELAGQGGFMRLPRVPSNMSFEFWVQLQPPVATGATIFSAWEDSGVNGGLGLNAFHMWLRPLSGDAVLDVCVVGQREPQRFLLPGVVSTAPQHFAASFEQRGDVGNWSYMIVFYRDCTVLLSIEVSNPCASFGGLHPLQLTLGQRFIQPEPGARGGSQPWASDFAAMYVAEVRIWEHVRNHSLICAMMQSRLEGNEDGLLSYAPVTASDYATAGRGARSVALANGKTFQALTPPAELSALAVVVTCGVDTALCPNFEQGVGFALRLSPFDLPPEEIKLSTTTTADITFDLVGHDPDNYVGHLLKSSQEDTIRFELLDVPIPQCGHLYTRADESFRIPDLAQRQQFGLPPTVVTTPGLRFKPFEGASPAQKEAMGGTCKSMLRYRALDTRGLVSNFTATIEINVWRPGVQLLSVEASDPSSVGALRLLQFTFSHATDEVAADVRNLLHVSEGSWGSSPITEQWVNESRILVLQIGSGTSHDAAVLMPGITRFKVNPAVRLRTKGDPNSAPCSTISSPLMGSFDTTTCLPGSVFNLTLGACSACSEGTFWSASSPDHDALGAKCLHCPGGRFGSSQSALACARCEPGRYMPETYADRSACLLATPGTFVGAPNATHVEPCLHGAFTDSAGKHECVVCPLHAECHAPGNPGRQAVADAGYFQAPDGSFRQCRVPEACPGRGVCVEGSQDLALGCYPCKPLWSRSVGALLHDSRKCIECPNRETANLIVLVVMVTSALLVVYIARLNIAAARHKSCLHSFMLKLVLSHLFLMNAFTMLEEWELEPGFGICAPALRQIMVWVFTWDGMLPLQFIPFECMSANSGTVGIGRLWSGLGVSVACLVALAFGLVVIPFCCLLPRLFCMRSQAETSGRPLNPVVPSGQLAPGVGAEAGSGQASAWEAVWSEEHNRHYYYNNMSGESTWNRPALMPPAIMDHSHAGHVAAGSSTEVAGEIEQQLEHRVLGIWRSPKSSRTCRQWLSNYLEDSQGIVLSVLVLAYPALLRHLTSLIRCDDLDGQRRLIVAPEVLCSGPDYSNSAIGAWMLLALWGLGLPATCFMLTWRSRRMLHAFTTRVRIGVISSEYEAGFFYWDSVTLLMRFTVILVVSVSSASQELRLVLLLIVGMTAYVIVRVYMPFENSSGEILDSLHATALKIFCATSSVLLLGLSKVTHTVICAVAAFILIACHVLFVLHLIRLFFGYVRRSIAEHLIKVHMRGGARRGCCGRCCLKLRELVFIREVKAQQRAAKTFYNADTNSVVIAPGLLGKIRDHEQFLVAYGIAACVSHAIEICKAERLSMHFVEFLVRRAFAESAERLHCTERVWHKLRPSASSDSASAPQRMAWHHNDSQALAKALFDVKSFQLGMSTIDFQGMLDGFSHTSKDQLEQSFHDFMVAKGCGDGDYEQSPHQRMLAKFIGVKHAVAMANLFKPDVNAVDVDTVKHEQTSDGPPKHLMETTAQLALPSIDESIDIRHGPEQSTVEVPLTDGADTLR